MASTPRPALVVLLALLVAFSPWTGRGGAASAPVEETGAKMTADLVEMARRLAAGDAAGARRAAAANLVAGADAVRVVVRSRPGAEANMRALAESLGAAVEGQAPGRLQVRAPLGALEPLARSPSVASIAPPLRPVPAAEVSEGVSVIGADTWHAAGRKGAGVKVAVVDLGFAGYQDLLGTELPRAVTARSFRADGDITGSADLDPSSAKHGTAVAEVVYDVAPGAQLYLVNFSTEVELSAAVDWLIAQHVQVVNASFGMPCGGPLDGTGDVDDIVAHARAGGILWVNAAGNSGDSHWSGSFADPDEDDWHNFNGADRTETVHLGAGQILQICLQWDDWTSRTQDYDLYVLDADGNELDRSDNEQAGDLEPVERVTFIAPADGDYGIAIKRRAATRNVRFDMFVRASADPCAATVAVEGLAAGPATLTALRVLRDQAMAGSPFGQWATAAFYRHSPEVARLLLTDSALRSRAGAFLTRAQPFAAALAPAVAEGPVADPVLTPDLVAEAERLMDTVAARSSGGLADDLAEARARMALHAAIGLSARTYWARLGSTPPIAAPLDQAPGHLEYTVASHSILVPADSPNALTVGAVRWDDDGLEGYSSRGPTADNRVKPDIVGPTRICTTIYGDCGGDGFAGTSASAPHVAGAAALVKGALPSLSPAELQSYLEGRARRLPGHATKDSEVGAGRLALGEVPVSTPPPGGNPGPGAPTATPVPRSTPGLVEATIGIDGGRLEATDGALAVDVPPGAVGTAVRFDFVPRAKRRPPPGKRMIGAFALMAGGGAVRAFDQPLTLTYTYDPDALGEVDEDSLAIYWLRGLVREQLPSQVDRTSHTVNATTDHFTEFEVLGSPATPTPPPTPVPLARQIFVPYVGDGPAQGSAR